MVTEEGFSLGHVTWMLDSMTGTPFNMECVIVGEDNVAKELVLLCLVPDNSAPGQYKRVGLCQWNGLTWQVAKHVGKEVEELTLKTFIIE